MFLCEIEAKNRHARAGFPFGGEYPVYDFRSGGIQEDLDYGIGKKVGLGKEQCSGTVYYLFFRRAPCSLNQ